MSGRRDLMLSLAKRPIDWWEQPLTFIARRAGASVWVNYSAGTASILPYDDMKYRYGVKGEWLDYVYGQTFTASAEGETIQFMCGSTFFSKGTSSSNTRRMAVSGLWTVNGNIGSLIGWHTSITYSSLMGVLYIGDIYTYIHIDNYASVGSYGLQTLQGSNNWQTTTRAQALYTRLTDWPANATGNWLREVTCGGTFYKPSILPTIFNQSHIPVCWDVIETDVDTTLPEGCEMATCITQTNTQYIDTGIKARTGLTTEIKFSYSNSSGANDILGATDGTDTLSLPAISGDTISYAYGASTGLGGYTTTSNTEYTIRCVNNKTSRQFLLMNATAAPTTLYSATASSEFDTDQTLYLGLRNNNGTPLTSSTCNPSIYYCRIWDEYNELLFDGVPVVDSNGKGAMYDRVGKTLKYSPDGADFEVTQDYSQDRIHFWLDALNNTGNGTVDTTSTTWVDLVGGNNIENIDLSLLGWENKALYKTNNVNSIIKTTNNIETTSGGACTVEIVFRIDGTTNINGLWLANMRNSGGSGSYMWQLIWYQKDVIEYDIWPQAANNTHTGYDILPTSSLPVAVCTAAYELRYRTDGFTTRCYCNGVRIQRSDSSTADEASNTWSRAVNQKLTLFGTGFGNTGVGYRGQCGIYAVRIYDRVLSEEELKYHSMLDQRRYS